MLIAIEHAMCSVKSPSIRRGLDANHNIIIKIIAVNSLSILTRMQQRSLVDWKSRFGSATYVPEYDCGNANWADLGSWRTSRCLVNNPILEEGLIIPRHDATVHGSFLSLAARAWLRVLEEALSSLLLRLLCRTCDILPAVVQCTDGSPENCARGNGSRY